jgi:hypothetical protein
LLPENILISDSIECLPLLNRLIVRDGKNRKIIDWMLMFYKFLFKSSVVCFIIPNANRLFTLTQLKTNDLQIDLHL